MSEKPFVPMSNYPRRAELATKAKAHAKSALALAATIELVASLHFFAGVLELLAPYTMAGLIGNVWIISSIGALLNAVLIGFVLRYSRHAGWNRDRLIITCVVLAAGSLLSFVLLPLGMLAVGITGVYIYRGLSTDLEAYGMTTHGNGVPKIELRQIVNADPYEVTPLG